MKIALLMLSHEDESGSVQNVFMPLSIGVIAEFLKLNYNEDDLEMELFKRPSKFEEYLQSTTPDIVLFGNYMWNEELNLYYASRLKSQFNNCLIVMGGPNVSVNLEGKETFLAQNPQVDILVEGDGEIVSLEILKQFKANHRSIARTKHAKIMNCFAYDHDADALVCGEVEDTRIGVGKTSLDDIPSPYVSGIMDVFFEDNAIPLLESNRGCPYACTYCQQGTKYFSKVRFFEGSRIGDEIEYIAKKKQELGLNMSIVEFTDPNFGMYKQDLDVFEGIRKSQDLYDFPKQVWCSTGKSQANRILAHAKMLKPDSIMIRAAMQSMNPETLKQVERKNLDISVFEEFSNDGVETYSDVMLGLPLETSDTYVSGILELIDSNIDEFSMPQTLVLKGTPMEATEYLNKFDIKTRNRVIPECTGVYGREKTAVYEFEQMIMHTSTMDFDGYLECRKFALIVMIFHNTRMLKNIYRYLDHKGIKRSVLLDGIFRASLKSEEFAPVYEGFLELVQMELLATTELPKGVDLDELTANKVYKFLSVALMNHRLALVELVQKSLAETSISMGQVERDFFIEMLNDTFFQVSESEAKPVKKTLISTISSAFDSEYYECFLSDFQQERISNLKNLYPKSEDRENKLPYHLRPANMIKTIRFA